MRPDVKLGVVFSVVVVFVAGAYYLFRDSTETPILIASVPGVASDATVADEPSRITDGKQVEPGSDSTRRETPVPIAPPVARERGSRVASREPTASTPPTNSGSKSPGMVKKPAPAAGSGAGLDSTSRPRVAGKGTVRRGAADDKGQRSGDKATRETPVTPSDALARLGRAAEQHRASQERGTQARSRRPVPLTAKRPGDTRHAEKGGVDKPGAATERHRVQTGDTFTSLAESYYGNAKYTDFLVKSNPEIADPNRLRVGAIVMIPPRPPDDVLGSRSGPTSVKSGARRVPDGRRTYRVKSGDTFYGIARDVLGNASRWKELFELNKELVKGDATLLQIGQVVVLPNP